MELYIEGFLQKSSTRGHDTSYAEINIYEEKGFDDYKENNEHESIQDVLK